VAVSEVIYHEVREEPAPVPAAMLVSLALLAIGWLVWRRAHAGAATPRAARNSDVA
jgi:hypothetical protein